MSLEIDKATYDILCSAGLEKMPLDWYKEIQSIITEDQARTVVANFFKGEQCVSMNRDEKPADGHGVVILAALQLRLWSLLEPRAVLANVCCAPSASSTVAQQQCDLGVDLKTTVSPPEGRPVRLCFCKAAQAKLDENEAEPEETEVDYTGVAKAWENNPIIRSASLKNKTLLQWINRDEVGVVTMKTVKLNVPVLTELLKIYLPQCPDAKTCNIELLKEQVAKFREELCLEEHQGTVHCEGAALKSMVTIINRRNDGCKRRDRRLRELYDLVTQYWAPKPRKTKSRADVDEEDDEEEEDGESGEEPTGEELAGEEPEEEEPQQEEYPGKEGAQDEFKGSTVEDPDFTSPINDLKLIASLGILAASPNPPSAYLPRASSPKPLPPTNAPSIDEQLAALESPVCNLPEVLHSGFQVRCCRCGASNVPRIQACSFDC
ncbi:unnamed protein product [Symbiodinium sp. CCMP2592]|nr:unnamed protein product [Symbiodinium sp. CCMP2592]